MKKIDLWLEGQKSAALVLEEVANEMEAMDSLGREIILPEEHNKFDDGQDRLNRAIMRIDTFLSLQKSREKVMAKVAQTEIK